MRHPYQSLTGTVRGDGKCIGRIICAFQRKKSLQVYWPDDCVQLGSDLIGVDTIDPIAGKSFCLTKKDDSIALSVIACNLERSCRSSEKCRICGKRNVRYWLN